VNRDGAHTGASEYAASKRIPCVASRSMVGVRATGSPYAPTYGEASSLMTHRTFGRGGRLAAAGAASDRGGDGRTPATTEPTEHATAQKTTYATIDVRHHRRRLAARHAAIEGS
jgi:hypothetical protein